MKVAVIFLLLIGSLLAEEIKGDVTIWYDSEGNVVMVDDPAVETKKPFIPKSERLEQERLARQQSRSLPGTRNTSNRWRYYGASGWYYSRPSWSVYWSRPRHHSTSIRGCYRHHGSRFSIILNR